MKFKRMTETTLPDYKDKKQKIKVFLKYKASPQVERSLIQRNEEYLPVFAHCNNPIKVGVYCT